MENTEEKNTTILKEIENFLGKNISFNSDSFTVYGDLILNNNITIVYHGSLIKHNNNNDYETNTKNDNDNNVSIYEENYNLSKNIYINYGYGSLWNNKNTLELKKYKDASNSIYYITINLIESENLYFCFMDNENNWDLNNFTSFALEISKPEISFSKVCTDIYIPEEDKISNFFKDIKEIIFIWINKFSNIFKHAK